MKKKSLVLTGIVACTGLAGCHPDPFSMKPDVNVTLPDESGAAGEAEPAEELPDEEEMADEAEG